MIDSENVRIHWSAHYLVVHSHPTFSAILRELTYVWFGLYGLDWQIVCIFNTKAEPHIRIFSENSRACWVRMGEQVMFGSVYLYILAIRHLVSNTFSALPNFWKNWWIPYLKVSSRNYSSIYARAPENVTNIRYLPIRSHS